jgi:outer membrane protein assembly factor BamB
MGISSFCDGPLVHGGLKEYDQASGNLQATYLTLPPSAGVGGSIWTSPAAATDGSIFVTTGNGGTGVPPDADSIVRLAGSNLARLDGWQIPSAQQVKDGDFGGSPTLFTATLAGVPTPMVGACDKNGFYYALRRQSLSAGPVWSFKMADAYPLDGYTGQCDAAAIWDGSRLIEGGNGTMIGGKFYQGSVRSLDPATGIPMWETGLPGPVLGSPTEDGSGVVAAAVFVNGSASGVWLLDASTGKVLKVLSTNGSAVFSQPVFAQNNLFLAGSPALGVTEEH